MIVSFIGAGNMGGALATAAAGRKDVSVLLYDLDEKKAGVLAEKIGGHAVTLAQTLQADFLFLGVKPQVLPQLAKEFKPLLDACEKKPILVTMAAGKSLDQVQALFGKHPMIRIMPNTPASVGEGVILYALRDVAKEAEEAFRDVLAGAGLICPLAEEKIDAASALTGCGPAFVYLFLEGLADGAVACGLPRDLATRFAAATVKGAAELALVSGKHPGELKDAVCSPGGTTIEGVRALEEKAFRGASMGAVVAAYRRTVELGKE